MQLRYFFTPDVTASMKYTRGWKGPQFNIRDGQSAAGALDLANPEKLDALEWNMGGTWFDGRLSAARRALLVRLPGLSGLHLPESGRRRRLSAIVVNASDARLYGAEIEATVEPIEGLTLDLRLGWLESRFLDFTEIAQRQVSQPPHAERMTSSRSAMTTTATAYRTRRDSR